MWKPSKFVNNNGKLKASRDPKEVWPPSRIMADLVVEKYSQYIPEYACGRLLDLGCGKVPLYEIYKDHVDENTCVDWDNSDHGNLFLDLIADLTNPLPFSEEEFETVILSDVLEHLRNPLGASLKTKTAVLVCFLS